MTKSRIIFPLIKVFTSLLVILNIFLYQIKTALSSIASWIVFYPVSLYSEQSSKLEFNIGLVLALMSVLIIFWSKKINYIIISTGFILYNLLLFLTIGAFQPIIFGLNMIFFIYSIIFKDRSKSFSIIHTSLIVFAFILASTFLIHATGSEIANKKNAFNKELDIDKRIVSTVNSAFRDNWFSYKTSFVGTKGDQVLNESNTKYYGIFYSKNCNETGSTTVGLNNAFDYRHIFNRYFTRKANSGNLWKLDRSGLGQEYLNIEGIGELSSVAPNEDWGICGLLLHVIPTIGDMYNTSMKDDRTPYYIVKINPEKLRTYQLKSAFDLVFNLIKAKGLGALLLLSDFNHLSSTSLKYDEFKYIIGDDGIVTKIEIGEGVGGKFTPHSFIELTRTVYSPIAVPNYIDHTPKNTKEALQIKNR